MSISSCVAVGFDAVQDEAGLSIADERAVARTVINDNGYQVFTWDTETASGTVAMMIVAGEVRVDETRVRH